MSSRSNKWIIHDNGTSWSLSKGSRFLYENLNTKNEALGRLKTYHKAGEPVILEESDGYRTNITQQLRRAGLIR